MCAQTEGLQGRPGLDSNFPLRSLRRGKKKLCGEAGREGKKGEEEG